MLFYAILADVVSVIHFAYICYVVFGQLAILVGWPLEWRWIRNPWFRITHLATILVVAIEAIYDYTCPLTTWERNLRELAGQIKPDGDESIGFIGDCIDRFMRFDGMAPVLNICYYGFAGLVLATIILVPPRFRRRPVPASTPRPEVVAGQSPANP